MRWWLLSAEQWRQKWLNVRNERNRLKEENIRLKKELMEIKNKIKKDFVIINKQTKCQVNIYLR